MALGIGPGDEASPPVYVHLHRGRLMGLNPFWLMCIRTPSPSTRSRCAPPPLEPRPSCPCICLVKGDMDALMDISETSGVPIIEDTPKPLGPPGAEKPTVTGSQAHRLMAHEFFPSKNLGCMGDGGAIVTSDNALRRAVSRSPTTAWSSNTTTMWSASIHDWTGCAAILRVKLKHLGSYLAARQAAAVRYDGTDGWLHIPVREHRSSHVFHQYTLKIEGGKRDALRTHLAEHGIPSGVYYPVPGHAQQAFSQFQYNPEAYPVSSTLAGNVLSLPMHTELNEEQQQFISGDY